MKLVKPKVYSHLVTKKNNNNKNKIPNNIKTKKMQWCIVYRQNQSISLNCELMAVLNSFRVCVVLIGEHYTEMWNRNKSATLFY